MGPPCTSKSVSQQTDSSKNVKIDQGVKVIDKDLKRTSDIEDVESRISDGDGEEMSEGDDTWSDSSPITVNDEAKTIVQAQKPSCSKVLQQKRKHENSTLRTVITEISALSKRLNSESNKTDGSSSSGKEKTKTRCVIPTKDNPPPELHDWLVQFQKWSNAERLLGLDQLIKLWTPSQVRHVMQVIEPQFQRDFISLLPKEVC